MKKSLKRLIIILVIVLAAVAAASVFLFKDMAGKLDAYISQVNIEYIDITGVADGTYYGEADASVVTAAVMVTVKDGSLTEIELLEHKNGKGEPGEQVIDRMLESQRVDVDTIAGATYSSLIIQDAVRKALLGEE